MSKASPSPESPLERLLADVKSPRLRKAAGLESQKKQLFGDFQLLKKLGTGGMGTVWEAQQESIKRRVAIKILDQEMGLAPKAMERFQREARAGARIGHPAIATVYELGEAEGIPFIAQELIEGGKTLEDFYLKILKQDVVPDSHFNQMAKLFLELAEGLESAHSVGVIHRDIKPQNILITPNGSPRIVDFGLANLTDAQDLARTGDFLGTPYYMSPEQAASKRMGIDHRTDIFSLGATLYEALTLARPFPGDSYPQVIKNVLVQDPINPKDLRSQIPKELAIICMKSLEKNVDKRYATMEHLAEDLRRYLENRPIRASPPGLTRKIKIWLRRQPVFATAASISLATLGLSAWLWLDSQERITKAKIGYNKATIATAKAEKEEAVAKTSVNLVIDALKALSPDRALGKNITVDALIQQSLLLLNEEGQLDSESRKRVENALLKISNQK